MASLAVAPSLADVTRGSTRRFGEANQLLSRLLVSVVAAYALVSSVAAVAGMVVGIVGWGHWRGTLTFSVEIPDMDYALSDGNARLRTALQTAVRVAVAEEVGGGAAPRDVRAAVPRGGGAVECVVHLATASDARLAESRLVRSTTFSNRLASSLAARASNGKLAEDIRSGVSISHAVILEDDCETLSWWLVADGAGGLVVLAVNIAALWKVRRATRDAGLFEYQVRKARDGLEEDAAKEENLQHMQAVIATLALAQAAAAGIPVALYVAGWAVFSLSDSCRVAVPRGWAQGALVFKTLLPFLAGCCALGCAACCGFPRLDWVDQALEENAVCEAAAPAARRGAGGTGGGGCSGKRREAS